ncbi:MAG: UDP-N-acetylenolpyruvoylglucosamine reductase, partial [Cyanobacteriota bacterium]
VKTLTTDEIKKGYRETIFTGIHSRLILSAILKFEKKQFESDPILERREWAKEHQDNVQPNCGSVFKFAYQPIMNSLKGFRIGQARYSSKTVNWILNQSNESTSILILITITKLLHFIVARRAVLEIILVK